jgi:hypothetical protein
MTENVKETKEIVVVTIGCYCRKLSGHSRGGKAQSIGSIQRSE